MGSLSRRDFFGAAEIGSASKKARAMKLAACFIVVHDNLVAGFFQREMIYVSMMGYTGGLVSSVQLLLDVFLHGSTKNPGNSLRVFAGFCLVCLAGCLNY